MSHPGSDADLGVPTWVGSGDPPLQSDGMDKSNDAETSRVETSMLDAVGDVTANDDGIDPEEAEEAGAAFWATSSRSADGARSVSTAATH